MKEFKYWGGRGISVHPEWRDSYSAFKNWIIANLGDKPDGMSLDRRDNNGNYEPGNLRWATPAQQTDNRREGNTPKSNTSGFKGVHFDIRKKNFRARVSLAGKRFSLGAFSNAARANEAIEKFLNRQALVRSQ